MATEIDVVEINNDNNDNNNNRLQTNETETSDEVEINNNNNVLKSIEEVDNASNISNETHANDVNTIEDTNTKPSNEDETSKPKRRNRPELKEKTSCPDCGKELTVHGLKYTHKKYCKAKTAIERPVPVIESAPIPQPMPKLERTVTTHEKTVMKDIEDTPYVPSDDQIAAYLLAQKKIRVNKKREQMSRLVSKALPQ